MRWNRILREPLLHFLLAGGVLFGIYRLTHEAEVDLTRDKTIVVDKQGLLNFLQYRSKAFETEYFTHELDAMSAEERKSLVDQYIEEEMLYRQAKALGLEQGDYVIRQRLVQKMRYLIDDLTEAGATPGDAALNDYLQKHKEIYTLEPSFTFTHVFVDSSIRSDAAAKQMAERLKTELNSRGAAFNDAPQFGDRFPYHENYVERTLDYVQSHFGKDFASEIAKVTPSSTQWKGPVRSMHGYHLILLTARSDARLPELREIRTQVAEDWERDRTQAARSLGLSRLAKEYTVERRDLEASSGK
jgi:hypothetical protein